MVIFCGRPKWKTPYIKDNYGKKAKLLFIDANSLGYEIKTNDVYNDLYKNKDMFNNTISLSRHDQVCLMRLRFERYFYPIASLNILVHDVINLLYYEH